MPYLMPWAQLAEDPLSKDMIRAWTNFAKTGQPGKMGTVEWESAFTNYHQPETKYMHLHSGSYKMVAGAYVEVCDNVWRQRIIGV